MKKKFFLSIIFVIFSHVLYSDNGVSSDNINETQLPSMTDSNQAKIIYVKVENAEEISKNAIYVGQNIKITYSLLLFSNARFVGTEFVGGIDTNKLILRNPNTKWKLSSDGSYQAVYEYKIKTTDAVIPPLKVIALSSDGSYSDSSTSPSIKLNIIDLYQNKKYAGVVADKFNIARYRTKTYDNLNNILVFEIEAENSNLEDLKIPNISKQGFESGNFDTDNSEGIYYCILPKNIQDISFEYFSLQEDRFKSIKMAINPVDDMVSTQDDVKPKNNFLLFSNIFTMIILILLLIGYFVFKRKKIFLVVFGILLIYLLWNVFYTKQVVLLSGAKIRILPTYNSTILEIPTKNEQVEIIDRHQKYYKIKTDDEKTGWVDKDDIK
ncbi:SH3 domain-containing protein [Helicobacter cappadocius]|uniref:SH3 domain-containing protein n=1 Tax=Helicobacter cappadocius TaxID=3063998 RepID=A0AA90Q439_9HELI|nr:MULTISPECIES: SH3 domain-containing protein [unclassified Helicobacter]MDO7253851.1 SH3 domain-containing protein [Helicobacter sp. faydin-H75]MDP2539803.1 SH3 domain-containing protein [Helicobacter sp. faydin-H76]